MSVVSAKRPKSYRDRFGLHKLMILPAAALFTVFFAVPFLQGIYMAFTNWNGFARMDFIGLENFRFFLGDDRARSAIGNTLLYGVLGTLTLNLTALMIAVYLDSLSHGAGVLRTVLYFPTIISPLIMGFIWKFILSSENGVILDTLTRIGVPYLYQDWLGNPAQARIVIPLVYVWQNVGGGVIIYLAGLQSIDHQMIESAEIDGANGFQTFWRVKFPLLTPSLRINVITSIIGTISIFDIVVSLTNGGPGYSTESLSQFIYRQSTTGQAGYAAAVSMAMMVIIMIPVCAAFILMRRMYMEN